MNFQIREQRFVGLFSNQTTNTMTGSCHLTKNIIEVTALLNILNIKYRIVFCIFEIHVYREIQ